MKNVCVGGGPARVVLRHLSNAARRGDDITVIERDRPAPPTAWGGLYWDDLLDILRNDSDSAQALRAASVLWQEQRVILHSEQTAYPPGYVISVGRATLLDIVAQRATDSESTSVLPRAR